MKTQPYTPRTPAELRKALRWALKRLALPAWDCTLVVGRAAETHPDLRGADNVLGNIHYWGADLRATIGVRDRRRREVDSDPLEVLFHEVAHLAMEFRDDVDPDDSHQTDWERTANRMASLMMDAYQSEGLA